MVRSELFTFRGVQVGSYGLERKQTSMHERLSPFHPRRVFFRYHLPHVRRQSIIDRLSLEPEAQCTGLVLDPIPGTMWQLRLQLGVAQLPCGIRVQKGALGRIPWRPFGLGYSFVGAFEPERRRLFPNGHVRAVGEPRLQCLPRPRGIMCL